MTPQEKAVIEAATRWYFGPSDGHDEVLGLDDAVEALLKARKPENITAEQLAQMFGERSGRARNVFLREQEASLRSPDPRWTQWPPVRTARDFASLTIDEITAVRQAGPHVWKVWADVMSELGVDRMWITWAKGLEK